MLTDKPRFKKDNKTDTKWKWTTPCFIAVRNHVTKAQGWGGPLVGCRASSEPTFQSGPLHHFIKKKKENYILKPKTAARKKKKKKLKILSDWACCEATSDVFDNSSHTMIALDSRRG